MITRFAVTSALVRRLAFASLLANIGIVLTGGAVRLTGSGLGCPTWPRCTEQSWTATSAMGLHGAVEFGNRTLTFVLGAIALAGLLAALALRPRRGALTWPATAVLAGIAAQGLIGGITVWTDLNPWVVGSHFLVSMALIAAAYTFWRHARGLAGPGAPTNVAPPLRALTWLIAAVTVALLGVGTVVTGSGPHAGDADVPRTGLDPQLLSQVHADLAFLLLGLAVAGWLALRAAAPPVAARAGAGLVVVILAQGAVGLVQYFTGLPELVVGLHLLGSCLVWLAVLHLLAATRAPHPAGLPAAPPAPLQREMDGERLVQLPQRGRR